MWVVSVLILVKCIKVCVVRILRCVWLLYRGVGGLYIYILIEKKGLRFILK